MKNDGDERAAGAAIPRCTQPHCYLQKPGVDSTQLAELVVQLFRAADASEAVPADARIHRRDVCRDCVVRVMEGHSAYWTDEQVALEKKKLVEAGSRSYRRQRRRG